jgi:hypothetical protein
MGTMREHAEELQDRKRWLPAGALGDETVLAVKCPWCVALVLDAVEDLHTHGQWHVSHMVAHDHDESVPSGGPQHPEPG